MVKFICYYLSKVDDDCLVPDGWAEKLLFAHEANPEFGVIGCWHYREEDYNPEAANKKIFQFKSGHCLMRNCWLGGSGYLIKRECIKQNGLILEDEGFSNYCIRLAKKGWINGWYYPFIYQDHMDDPMSSNTQLKKDDDIVKWMPLSAINNGIDSIAKWNELLRKDALFLQRTNYDVKYHSGWRKSLKNLRVKIRNYIGDKRTW